MQGVSEMHSRRQAKSAGTKSDIRQQAGFQRLLEKAFADAPVGVYLQMELPFSERKESQRRKAIAKQARHAG